MEDTYTDYDSVAPISSDGFDYYVDLGSGALDSPCPTPQRIHTPQPSLPRPIARRPGSQIPSATMLSKSTSTELDQWKQVESLYAENELKCGIWCVSPLFLFPMLLIPTPISIHLISHLSIGKPASTTHATLPTRSHLFCADHIPAWLHAPSSEGLCPVCRSPALGGSLRAEIPSSQPVEFEFCAAHPSKSSSSFSSPYSSSMYSTSHYEYSNEPEEDDDQRPRFEPHYPSRLVLVEESGICISRIIPLATWVVLVLLLGWRGRWEEE
ncbi:hypothetical protein R3P38DRAFT_3230442 [Favolaschia claudopus]|uniref:RING-type domain-containing protein n=1 Tax=Favolaschia claudopus TaxID=2862362 RepID=A0AAV9ZMX6_9AGAR